MAPATAAWDRGRRREAYGRAGVPYFWIAIPETERLEIYELDGEDLQPVGIFYGDESFTHPLFPGYELLVGKLLRSRWYKGRPPSEQEWEEEPEFTLSPDQPIGLQDLLLMGHPDRRYEILDNRTPCVVAFGSEASAEQRFRGWAEEIGRWEGVTVSVTGDRAEAGRFTLRRDGPRVALDVATSGATYRQLLEVYHRHDVWDEWHEMLEDEA
jgi:hypothetical protein